MDKTEVVEIKIDGAVTNYPLADSAAKEFMKENPGAQIDVKQTNTATGIQKLIDGEIDIADSTRLPVNTENEAAKAKGMTLHGTVEC